ncbi:MAG TPA: sigma-54 dependent transcriptional regulator, partial [Polyangiaceae bacterium]
RALTEVDLHREASVLRRALHDSVSQKDLVAESPAMREATSIVTHVADTTAPVLLLGETGVGKGLLARALHNRGKRASGSFVAVNCAALPEHLLESELFGHVRGAFTGATSNRVGLFEEASGGTLFLDEIGEMPAALQAKLLHVLETNEVRPLGTNKSKRIDVRIVAATHRDLQRRVAEEQFREDLFFRLNVVTIEVPPLRNRRADFAPLVARFLEQSRARHTQSPVRSISPAAFEHLLAHRWPGNVRELANVIERVVLLGTSESVAVTDLPRLLGRGPTATPDFSGPVLPLDTLERRYARWALDELGGKKMVTAERLQIDRKTLARLLAEHDGEDDG